MVNAMPEAAVRPAAVAGAWYPGTAEALKATVESLLDAASEGPGVSGAQSARRVVALVAPHAGFPFSGPTAAHAYAQVRGQTFRRVLLLGPLHRPIPGSALGRVMVPAENAYATPLGQVALDRDFLQQLDARVDLTEVHRDQEHSLEIQLPFLQTALAAPFNLVPLMLGEYIGDPGVDERVSGLASALADLVAARDAEGERTLLVASTDLSHLHNYEDVVRTDRELVNLVSAGDVAGVAAALRAERVMACGATGLVAVLRAAQRLGATGLRVLAYAASGDVTGDKRPGTYTVGYMAAAAYA